MKHNGERKRIGEFLTPSKNQTILTPHSTYAILGMSLEGRGLFIREKKLGSEIASKSLTKVSTGEFIYSRLFAWKGAFDYVKDDFDGYFVSGEFPVFKVDENQVDVKFLHYYFNQRKIWKEVEKLCVGVTKASRYRFKEKYFLALELNLPLLSHQKKIAARIEKVKKHVEQIKEIRKQQSQEINNLLFSKYTELIESAEWLPMKEVAPIIRREVTINNEQLYPELGIRSFGKGTFHKPSLTGVEIATKRIFRIQTGDLVFSNVFAWEGAIAVAKKEDNDRFGSHRFISCVAIKDKAIEEFLCFHFLSQKGLEDINACSPGGAGRNKTLGLEKLMKIRVPIPDISLQREFVDLLHKFELINQNHAENEKQLLKLIPSLVNEAYKEGI